MEWLALAGRPVQWVPSPGLSPSLGHLPEGSTLYGLKEFDASKSTDAAGLTKWSSGEHSQPAKLVRKTLIV